MEFEFGPPETYVTDTETLKLVRGLRGSSETMIRSLDPKGCPACSSRNITRQTPAEGRPFSCNNCGLEFFEDTPKA